MDLRFTNLLEFELRSNPGLPVTVLNFGREGADTNEGDAAPAGCGQRCVQTSC